MNEVRILAWCLLLCGSALLTGGTKVIPTVVRKSKNSEGLVCLYVSRGERTRLHPTDRQPFSKSPEFKMNTKRGIRGRNSRNPPIVDSKEAMDRFKTFGIIPYTQSKVKANPAQISKEVKTTKQGSSLKRHLQSSPEPLNEFTDHQVGGEDISLTHVQQEESAETFIQEDQLTHQEFFQFDPHNESHLSEYSDSKRQPSSGRQFALLRPLQPTGTRRVVPPRVPIVQVSLMVSATYEDMQFFAGEASLDSKLLTNGLHILRFKQTIANSQRDLRVELDGLAVRFTSSTQREYPVRSYRAGEVWIKLQGPVTFVANNSCQAPQLGQDPTNRDQVSNGGHLPDDDQALDGNQSFIPNEKSADPNDTKINFPNDDSQQRLPKNVIRNEVIKDQTIVHTIILNSTIDNSNISFSYVNNSVLTNTNIDNSLLIVASITNSSIWNSTLHNVTFYNCGLHDTRTTNSVFDDSTTTHSNSLNETKWRPNFSRNHGLDSDETAENNMSSVAGLDMTMLVFGIMGMIVLVLVIAGVIFFIARKAVKKKKEMLLVRSAVMGNVKSW